MNFASIDRQAIQDLKDQSATIQAGGPAARKLFRDVVEKDIMPDLLRKVKAEANGVHARAALDAVSLSKSGKPAIAIGQIGGEKAKGVVFGSVFGGNASGDAPYGARSTYARRSRRGGYHIVSNRRTTTGFRPHLGRDGYWVIPTLSREFPNTVRKLTNAGVKVLNDLLETGDVGDWSARGKGWVR